MNFRGGVVGVGTLFSPVQAYVLCHHTAGLSP